MDDLSGEGRGYDEWSLKISDDCGKSNGSRVAK